MSALVFRIVTGAAVTGAAVTGAAHFSVRRRVTFRL